MIEPDVVDVPGGEFAMGDVWGDGEPDEQPLMTRRMEPFQMGRFAVTALEYVEFLNSIQSDRSEDGQLLACVEHEKSPFGRAGKKFCCRDGRERYPATFVSWWGAREYASWLSSDLGQTFRLPTESQWQYASTGAQGLKWSLGNHFDRDRYVSGADGPAPVDFGTHSLFGCYNLTGNVFEWCADEYSFRLDASTGPRDTLNHHRVIKGGAFILSDAANLRNSKRFSCFQNSCLSSIGFRIVSLKKSL